VVNLLIYSLRNEQPVVASSASLGQALADDLLSVLVIHFSQYSAVEDEIATLRDLVGKVVKKVSLKVSL
jgi:hypothetical protein